MNIVIKEIIARRTLYLVDNKDKEIVVIIGKPNQFPDHQDYYCPYKITGLGDEKVRYAGGIDAIQAIQLAMVMIGAQLYTSNEAKTGHLRWEGDEEGNLGFPAPN
jgi:hypothetical protein